MNSGLMSLLWFVAILALIPAALWLLKRTPMGGAGAHGLMRTVAVLPISANQRLLAVEVGTGEERRWLVLGVTGQQITTLHTMAPQAEAAAPPAPGFEQTPFGQLLAKFQKKGGER
ncbi:MAG: flagellar biosynthetic protein FliO [Pseudomonadota bacterium]